MTERNKYSNAKYPLQDETYEIIGICMEVHHIFGKGLLEIVYKDALEYELICELNEVTSRTPLTINNIVSNLWLTKAP